MLIIVTQILFFFFYFCLFIFNYRCPSLRNDFLFIRIRFDLIDILFKNIVTCIYYKVIHKCSIIIIITVTITQVLFFFLFCFFFLSTIIDVYRCEMIMFPREYNLIESIYRSKLSLYVRKVIRKWLITVNIPSPSRHTPTHKRVALIAINFVVQCYRKFVKFSELQAMKYL